MAFSLKSVLLGKERPDGSSGGEDDPPSAAEAKETPPSNFGDSGGPEKTGLFSRLAGLLPGGTNKADDLPDGPDPLDDPALLALIATEVADLAPPQTDDPFDETAPAAQPEPDGSAETDGDAGASADGHGRADKDDPLADTDGGAEEEDGDVMAPDAAPLGPIGPDHADMAYQKRRRGKNLQAAILSLVVLGGLGGGGWLLFGGEEEVEDKRAATSRGISVNNESRLDLEAPRAIDAEQKIDQANRVEMAFPPPPVASGDQQSPAPKVVGALGDEKSASRRPWLNGGGSGEPATGPDAQRRTAVDRAQAENTGEREGASSPPAVQPPLEDDAPGARVAPPAPTDVADLGDGGAARRTTSGASPAKKIKRAIAEPAPLLPPLIEPPHPAPPSGDRKKPPSYAALPTPEAPPRPLAKAPARGLARQSPLGPLPVKSKDGNAPWMAYARPFEARKELARVVVVVTGLGPDPDAVNAAIDKLPPEVSLSFSPYARQVGRLTDRAREAGHETLLDLPMEPRRFPLQDPGPLGLLTMIPQDEIMTRIESVLGKAQGYVGVVGTRPGKFADSRAHMRLVLDALGKRGLMLVQAPDALKGLSDNEAQGAPVAPAVVRLDGKRFTGAIDARLDYLVAVARETTGVAVGLAEATPLFFQRLLTWTKTLAQKRAALAPVSEAGRILAAQTSRTAAR